MNCNQLRFTAGGFDLLFRLGGKAMRLDRQSLAQRTVAKNLDAPVFAADIAVLDERFRCYFRADCKSFQLAKIDYRHFNSKWIVKTAFWQTPLEWHLPAFKSGLRIAAGARALAFV